MLLENFKNYCEKDQETTAFKGFRGLNFFGSLKFSFILLKNNRTLNKFERDCFKENACYIGPFIGEFGNFLLHIVPFLSYLYKNKIDIYYCGMANQAPFLIDDNGVSLVKEFVYLRDFFHEVKPSGNRIDYLPTDVYKIVRKFQNKSRESNIPYLDIYSDVNLYWYSYRNWQLKSRQHIFKLSNYYLDDGKKNKVVIFPRKMSTNFTQNNGGVWDYNRIGILLSKYFEEVVFIGHPAMSESLNDLDSKNFKLDLSNDNLNVLKHCSNAKLIVSQHSGAVHVSGYTQTPLLIIYNGLPPIKGLDDTLRFRANFPYNNADIVFNYEGIKNYCNNIDNE